MGLQADIHTSPEDIGILSMLGVTFVVPHRKTVLGFCTPVLSPYSYDVKVDLSLGIL